MSEDRTSSGPNPWGEKKDDASTGAISGFEDSFADCTIAEKAEGSIAKHCTIAEEADESSENKDTKASAYIPLKDSKEHIAKLERKLEKFQRKNRNELEKPFTKEDRQRVLAAIEAAKKEYNIVFLSKAMEAWDASFDDENEEEELTNKGTVDPKGAAGKVMRKCVPLRIALSRQELVNLLSADMLSRRHNSNVAQETQEKSDKEEEEKKEIERVEDEEDGEEEYSGSEYSDEEESSEDEEGNDENPNEVIEKEQLIVELRL